MKINRGETDNPKVIESDTSKITETTQKRRNVRSEVAQLRQCFEERFKNREENDQKKMEQRQQLIDETKRKNDLLEKLIDIFKKE